MTDQAINRYQRNAEARAQAERKRSHANFKVVVIGLIFVVAATYWFAYRDEVDWQNLDAATITSFIRNRWTALVSSPEDPDRPFRETYLRVALEFTQGPLAAWKDLPAELKPKNAPAGTVYHALVPRESGFDLYELKWGGVAEEITPFGSPIPMTFADFKKACSGKPYFIACSGRVFACGDGDLKAMDQKRKRDRLFPTDPAR